MTWNEILYYLKTRGGRARRKNWSGDKWIEYLPGHTVQIVRGKGEFDYHAEMITFVDTIIIHCKDGRYGFYATTQCDMMADDWQVSEDGLWVSL